MAAADLFARHERVCVGQIRKYLRSTEYGVDVNTVLLICMEYYSTFMAHHEPGTRKMEELHFWYYS